MILLLVAWIFWIAVNGELGKYAAFVTTSNASGTLTNVFGGFSIPVKILTGAAGVVSSVAMGGLGGIVTNLTKGMTGSSGNALITNTGTSAPALNTFIQP